MSNSINRTFPKSVQPGIPRLTKIKPGWKRYQIGKLFTEVPRKIEMEDEKPYVLVTVKRSRGGIVKRDILLGKQISVKSQFTLKKDDFLISKRQIVHGACGIVPETFDGAIVSNEYSVLNCNANLDINFLNYLSYTQYFQQTCFHSSIGVHIEKMIFKLSDWFRWKIDIPPIKEQKKIATFLSTVDKKLTKLRCKHELLKSYKFGCMQKIFSQDIRFKQDDGSDFPDWEEEKLRDIADRVTTKNTDVNIKRVLTNSATKGVLDQQDYFDKAIANIDNLMGYYIVDKNDYVYNPRISVHAPVGPINKNKIGKGVMSPLYSVFRFKDKNNSFYEQYFKTTSWHKYMSSVANYGARHDRMNITTNDFLKMPLPYPTSEEQEKIVAFLQNLDKKIDAASNQIDQIEKFKKGLLQKMFV